MNVNEILRKTSYELGNVDIDQLPQILQKMANDISQMEKDLK
jgi:hypothetical protein